MFLPSNPFSRPFPFRSDPEEKLKSHPFDFFKNPLLTIVRGPTVVIAHAFSSSHFDFHHSLQLVAVLVMGAIAHASESGYTDVADPNNQHTAAKKSVSELTSVTTHAFLFNPPPPPPLA
jgi:hypothetical protein